MGWVREFTQGVMVLRGVSRTYDWILDSYGDQLLRLSGFQAGSGTTRYKGELLFVPDFPSGTIPLRLWKLSGFALGHDPRLEKVLPTLLGHGFSDFHRGLKRWHVLHSTKLQCRVSSLPRRCFSCAC